eukprot:3203980-Amphidinium_carterae.1
MRRLHLTEIPSTESLDSMKLSEALSGNHTRRDVELLFFNSTANDVAPETNQNESCKCPNAFTIHLEYEEASKNNWIPQTTKQAICYSSKRHIVQARSSPRLPLQQVLRIVTRKPM